MLLLLLLLLLGCGQPGVSAGDGDTGQEPVNRLTCYFCEDVQSNFICNRFAIDTPCPPDTVFCRTLHIMDNSGSSLVVNKHCAGAEQCRPDMVGCLQQDRQRTCVSCCRAAYCNKSVPTNHSNAVIDLGPTAPTRAVTSAGSRLGHGLDVAGRQLAVLSLVVGMVVLDAG